MLESGACGSVAELAAVENRSYLCRVLRLMLLAPELVEAILDGRQAEVTLPAPMRPFPVDWDQQQVWRNPDP